MKEIKEAQRLYYDEKLSFRQIAGILQIKLSVAIRYCTDLKHKIK